MTEANVPAAVHKRDEQRTLQELGAALREAREAKGMSQDDIAAATCIRKNFLEDIEAGRFDRFKALVYARGFVRTVTELLEAPDLWEEYRAQLTIDQFETLAAPEKAPAYPAGTGSRVSTLPPSSMRGGAGAALPTHGFRHSSARRNCIIALLLLASAAIAALVFNWDRIRSEIARIQSEQAYNEMKAREAEEARLAEKKKAEEEEVQRERLKRAQTARETVSPDKPAEVKLASPVGETAPVAAAPAKPALTIRAAGKCWLRVRAGRKTILETVVNEGWEQSFDLDVPLDVVYGFAQNVTVSTNGTDFASPGKGRQRYEYQTDGTPQRLRK